MPMVDSVAPLMPAIAGAVTAMGGVIKGSRFIQEGERGVKLRFGRVIRRRDGSPKIIEPGFVFVIPTIEHLRRAHVRTDTIDLPTQTVVLADRMAFNVSAVVIVQVQDSPAAIYRCLFEVEDVEKAVTDYCTAELRTVLSGLTHERVTDATSVAVQIKEAVSARLQQWGLNVDEVMLTDCEPTPESARAILTAASAKLRADALVAAADDLAKCDSLRQVPPVVAAAVIGTPVATALTGASSRQAIDTHGDE